MSAADSDREMLVRIDERVNGLVREVQSISTTFQNQMVTKPELNAAIARIARVETIVNAVLVAFIVAIVGAIAAVIFRGGA